MSRRSRWLPAATAVVLAAVLAAGAAFLVTRDRDGQPTDESTSPEVPMTWPLRGTPVGDGDAARPALAVKVDATAGGRPQVGLADADLVVEELVEGGLTRYLAVFHSRDPAEVGPVRSARSTDIDLLAELGRPLFAWSGANPTFRALVEDADLVDVGFAAVPDAYRRSGDRRAPYNLLATPDVLRDGAGSGSTTPTALFAFRAEGAAVTGPDARPAPGYRASTMAITVEWAWDPATEAWLRTQDGSPHVDAAGERITAANVVVRTTEYRDSGVRDSTGAVVPEAVSVGEGDAWLLTAGHAVPARWSKPSDDAPTTYTTLDGAPVLLTPGNTWVEILPPGTGDIVA